MIRSGLVQLIGKKNKIEMLRAELVVEAIFDCLKSALQRGEHVETRGFGSLHVRSYKGYKGRNPKTGESIQVKAKLLPYFKPSKVFSERINEATTKHALSGAVGHRQKARPALAIQQLSINGLRGPLVVGRDPP
jgi:integration host factor subunit beta